MTTSLEKRIADALAAVPMISSGDLAKLYSEVEVASAEADAAAKKAKDAAIDVVRSSDGRAARAAMEEAAFIKDRLQNSLPTSARSHAGSIGRREDPSLARRVRRAESPA